MQSSAQPGADGPAAVPAPSELLGPTKDPPRLTVDPTPLGQGAFGLVEKAFIHDRGAFSRLRDGQYVALKSMNEPDEKRRRMVELEIAMLKNMTHPNLVQYYGAFVDKGRFSILMEFCSGGSLHSVYTREGALPAAAVSSYIYQTLKALEYLHGNDVVHRDIKSMNILLSHDGVCKLGDFGAAVNIGASADRQFHSAQGTLIWMAPEVWSQNKGDFAVDVWSIGVTVWELCTGSLPFKDHASNQFGFMKHVMNAESDAAILPANLQELMPPEAFNFVRRCVRRNPDDRPSVAELLKDPFVAQDAANASTDAARAAPSAPPSLTATTAGGASAAAAAAVAPVAAAGGLSPGIDAAYMSKVSDALQWWTTLAPSGAVDPATFFAAFGCPHLLPELLPLVLAGRDGAGGGAQGPDVTTEDFVRFAQWMGPWEALKASAEELGRAGDAYAGYTGYGDYAYKSDLPQLLLTWHSKPYFRPLMDQPETEARMASAPVGSFLVRFSSKWRPFPGSYTLSLKGNSGKVSHYRIVRPKQAWSLVMKPDLKKDVFFDSLEDLLKYCYECGVRDVWTGELIQPTEPLR